MRRFTAGSLGSALACLMFQPALLAADTHDPSAIEFFEKKVRPVLVERCFECHSARTKKPKGALLLDSREAMLKGGDNGPAIVPGQPDKSKLIEAVRYANVDMMMPPKGKLSAAAIADLVTWVKAGAAWPAGGGSQAVTAQRSAFDLQGRKQAHWAWQPIRPRQPPSVMNDRWPHGPIDRFILAKLEAKGLAPAPAAASHTLVRRIYFDLLGLPPTPEEVEQFRQSASRDPQSAIATLVDRLLESPHFGERWGRHWLDLARYGESRGHEFDYVAPNAFQYRDYVIRAFNADLPYDQFVTEQIAGDLLPRPRLHPVERFNESILGTGFWFLGEQVHSPVDIRQDEADRFDNMIDVFSKTFLGMTVSCARCHDHKFDAISTKDYYALFGFLRSSNYRLARFESMERNRALATQLVQLRARDRAPLQAALAESLRPAVRQLADYLLTVRDFSLAGADPRKLGEIAQARKLDPVVLEHWAAHINQASRDPRDPLHAWAKISSATGIDDARRLADLLKPLVDGGRKRTADAAAALRGAELVIDYAKSSPESWLPDGSAYGAGPVRPGDVRFGTETSRPIVQVYDYAAAEKDGTWDRLRTAPGAQNDPGALGSLMRAGRTIRTPTFALTTGKVFYRVKGVGQAYASIDSHTLINGPLHARVVLPIKAGAQFQWIAHDLRDYKGQRIHVEFTAAGTAPFAVAMVVHAEQAPASVDRPNPLVQALLEGEGAGSVESLAQAYQRLFLDMLDRLAADKIAGAPDAADHAALADWLVQHPGLFAIDEKRLTAVAGPILADQARLVEQIKPESRLAMALMDGSSEDDHVFIRGSHKTLGETVPRRFLEALAGPAPLRVTHGSGRLELARQLTDPAINPLLARVMVNRIWHHLFGRGIVASVDNFGVLGAGALGEPPSHPELLDYLADRFMREGWSVKKLIRLLLLSSTYQMAAQAGGDADTADPRDRLLHRQRIRRLEGEAIRDAMLRIAGRLDPKMYGPSVPVYLTDFQQGRGRPASGPIDGDGRRSVYLSVRRNFLSSLLLAFDTPIPFSTVGRRTVSNVPAQSLILLNDPLVAQLAQRWAQEVIARSTTPQERIKAMYLAAFGRLPTDDETRSCREFLDRQARLNNGKPDDVAVWADLAHVLFNVKEFIFLN